jgi:cytoskeletal protein CcmA (bactofilin family)
MSGIARELSGAVVKLKGAAGFRTPVEEKAPVAANEDVAPARAEPTVISASSHLAGSISTADEVYVQGKVEGDVRAASVVVYEGGVVRGDISAEDITIYGAVTGNLIGGNVLLCDGSMVDGEITHTSLRIDAGANFEGSIKRKAAASVVAAE